MLDEFMRLVRKDMEGRGFCEIGASLPPGVDAVALVFAPAPVAWRDVFIAIPVVATGLDLLQNNTSASMASLVRKRCANAARAYMDRDLIYRQAAA